MSVVRYLLLVITGCGTLGIAGVLIHSGQRFSTEDYSWLIGLGVVSLLTFVYVLSTGPDGTRLPRLLRLWIDAKENELKRRASAAADERRSS